MSLKVRLKLSYPAPFEEFAGRVIVLFSCFHGDRQKTLSGFDVRFVNPGINEAVLGSHAALTQEDFEEELPKSVGQPLWEATVGQQDNWDAAPPSLHGIPLVEGEQWSFFKTDVWHNFHLGVAKHWLASAFVCSIEALPFLSHLSIDDRIAWLDERYKEFYKLTESGRETLTWPQSSICPVGNWHKGSVSAYFMQFLERLCTQYKIFFANDDLLDTIASRMDFYVFLLILCQLFVFNS